MVEELVVVVGGRVLVVELVDVLDVVDGRVVLVVLEVEVVVEGLLVVVLLDEVVVVDS